MKKRTTSTMSSGISSPPRSLNGLTGGVALKKTGSSPLSPTAPPSLFSNPETPNYILLLALYTLQGIPMGLSASIPFLIQQKIRNLIHSGPHGETHHPELTKVAYRAQAIFALCSWPFSLKLLWAPLVDALFIRKVGRRKSWLIPVQSLAGALMIGGSEFVERQLGFGREEGDDVTTFQNFDVKGVTFFFFVLYFLMATQDIAVDGWALTMLSKANRGKGPVMNSIGQNVGYFLSFVGFLALNDADTSENIWRPLMGLPSRPGTGLVSLGGFIRCMGVFMIAVTTFVAFFKHEIEETKKDDEDDEPAELDASEIGLAETYHRLWAVCTLPAVRWLFLILLTYRFPTALSDNVKFLKAIEFGLSKQTTALLSPVVVLPLGILVPIVASKIWHGHPLRQFLTAFRARVTLVPLLDVLCLLSVRYLRDGDHLDASLATRAAFWGSLISSTAGQAIVSSLQFNAQMTFFASRVDPAIGGSYMTLLNTAANLGGTWPASVVMFLVGQLTVPPVCEMDGEGMEVCTGGRDAYFPLQIVFSILGVAWLYFLGGKVMEVAHLPEDSWRTGIGYQYRKADSMKMDTMESGQDDDKSEPNQNGTDKKAK